MIIATATRLVDSRSFHIQRTFVKYVLNITDQISPSWISGKTLRGKLNQERDFF